jgi:hypothetical protein
MLEINKNNLSEDQSPYLQQHKKNPVNWQVWSSEVLKIAKKKKDPNPFKYWVCKLSLVSCDGTRKF